MRVAPPDLELWFTGYVRGIAAAENRIVDVDRVEPDDLALPLDRPLIVIRDDSGSRKSHATFDRSIGFSVLAGSKGHPAPAIDLANWLASILFDTDLPLADDCPIAAVVIEGCNGPYEVNDQLDVARRYGVAQYVAIGSW